MMMMMMISISAMSCPTSVLRLSSQNASYRSHASTLCLIHRHELLSTVRSTPPNTRTSETSPHSTLGNLPAFRTTQILPVLLLPALPLLALWVVLLPDPL